MAYRVSASPSELQIYRTIWPSGRREFHQLTQNSNSSVTLDELVAESSRKCRLHLERQIESFCECSLLSPPRLETRG
jgi:hypothetical protein